MDNSISNSGWIPGLGRLQMSVAVAATILSTVGGTAIAQEEERKGGYSLQLEEVVVTAQKREQDYMTVPLSVNAFTAQDMVNTGAVNIQDIDDFMPGVEVGEGGATQVSISVRGVSSPGISSGQDPSIATFYDGSYMPRAVTSIPFTDIARTEVLKGPQGTLFGRNATAGVINIVPNNPHDEFEGFVKTRVGNYNLLRLEGMLNAPITDNLAFRGNIFSHKRDGITSQKGIGDDVRDESFVAARASLLWTLSDDTNLQLSVDIEDRDEMPRTTIGVGKYAYKGNLDPFAGSTAHDVAAGQEETRDMYGVALKLNHDFNDQLSLFGIVSYRDWETTNLEEEDGTADPRRYLDTNNIEESDIWYSEFRLNYVNDKVNLIVGANYSEEEVFQRTDVGIMADSYMQFITGEFGGSLDDHAWDPEWLSSVTGFPPEAIDESTYLLLSNILGIGLLPPSFEGTYFLETMDNEGEFKNWGIFADLTYQLTDTIRLAGGLRYSDDDKDYSWLTPESTLDWPVPVARVSYDPTVTGSDPADYFNPYRVSDSWSKTTGRFVVDWAFSDEAMTYFSYATGYKSGGWDGQSFAPVVSGPFDPEEMTSIELGLKGDFFDNTLRVEAAIFHHELDNKQNSVDTKDSPDDSTSKPTVIGSDEETDGIELIVYWNVLENLRLTAMSTYRDSEEVLDEHFNAAGEPKGGETETSTSSNDYTLRLDWSPEIPVGYMLVHVDYVFKEVNQSETDTIFITGPWYFRDKELLSARISWQNDADNIEVALWGKNLLDNEYATNPGGFAAPNLGASHTAIHDPRTYGLDIRYSF
ncbi:MAG: TonB-dependent receptor [Halieaceae bacterium]|jgi:iron complex outermembrane recepter protein|nr:TonB-dependent receptor [Halieaceae bacterium]